MFRLTVTSSVSVNLTDLPRLWPVFHVSVLLVFPIVVLPVFLALVPTYRRGDSRIARIKATISPSFTKHQKHAQVFFLKTTNKKASLWMLFVYICCRLQDNFLLLRIFNGLFIYYSATTFDNLNQCPMHLSSQLSEYRVQQRKEQYCRRKVPKT